MSPTEKQQATYAEATLALSELHILAEALEKEHQWLLKQIKRKRNELKKFVEQMRSLATQTFHRGAPVFQQLMEIDQEIHAMFKEILTGRKMGKKTRQYILEIYQHLQLAGMVSPKFLDEDEEESQIGRAHV